MMRGWNPLFAAVLICATLNAVSYFVRSDRGGNLYGTSPENRAAIGFPWQIWEQLPHRDAEATELGRLLANLAVAAGVAGVLAVGGRAGDRRPVRQPLALPTDQVDQTAEQSWWPSFTLSQLLLATAVLAIVCSLLRPWNPPAVAGLRAVTCGGPILLVWVIHLTRRAADLYRLAGAVATALLLVGVAGWLAQQSPGLRDFTRGWFAVFVCWTPQLGVAAAAVWYWMQRHAAP